MANRVLIKRSGTANAVPSSANLELGELAINYTDGNLFYKDAAGNVAVIASNRSAVYSGNVTANTFVGSGAGLTSIPAANISGSVTTAVTAGTVTTNAQPNITSVGTLTSLNVTGNVGIGTNAPESRLVVRDAAATGTTQFSNLLAQFRANAAQGDASIQISNGVDSSARVGIIGGANMYFSQNGIEQMRLTSSGALAIGTTSALGRLTVRHDGGAMALQMSNTTGGTNLTFYQSNGDNMGGIYAYASGYTGGSLFGVGASGLALTQMANAPLAVGTFGVAQPLILGTNGAERMRIDSAGQVGIGFTPQSTQGNLQVYKLISGGAPATSGTTDANQVFAVNYASVQTSFGAYANGTGWIQQRAWGNFAVNYNLVLQPNGGNVGIGTASPGGTLTVYRATGTAQWAIQTLNNVNTGGSGFWQRADGSHEMVLRDTNNFASYITNQSNDLEFVINGSERARINSAGRVLIGKTSESELQAGGPGYVFIPGPQGYYSHVQTADTANFMSYYNRIGTTSGGFLFFMVNNSTVGSITNNGTNTAYNTSSDYRLKHNIQPMTGALARVAQLRPVTYQWNRNGSQGEGFIAHELAEVCPQAVTGEKDAVDEAGNPVYQGVDTGFLVATLVAAIQEQQAMIQTQQAQFQTLRAEFDAYRASHP